MKPIEEAKAAALPPPPPLLEPRHAPPIELLNAGGAVPVNVTAHVISLSDVDSREQRFEGHIWLQARVARARVHCVANARGLRGAGAAGLPSAPRELSARFRRAARALHYPLLPLHCCICVAACRRAEGQLRGADFVC